MRTSRLVVAAIVLLTLSGCVPSGTHAAASPSPSATPVFASEEEALAAAEKAYAEYLRVSDEILVDGGRDPQRLLKVATKSVYEDELAGFREVGSKGWHSTGGSSADNFSIEQFSPSDMDSVVTVYLCSDVSRVDVVDSSGVSVVSANRPDRTAFEVSFAYSDLRLLVSSKVAWTGGGIC